MTSVTSNIIFRDGLFRLPVPMSGDQITSVNINSNLLQDTNLTIGQQVRGSLTPSAIVFPTGWIDTDIFFEGFLDDTFTNPFDIMTGGITNARYVISSCAANTQVPLPLDIFANIKYFVIKTVIPQTASPIPTVIFFPLEQLSA